MKNLSVKFQLIIFLSCFAVFLSLKDKDPLFLFSAFLAVVSAAALDSLIAYLKNKKFLLTESSVISGLIIGYVVSSDEAWWKIILVSLFAIASKHLIRIKGKHIFNPAAFGVFLGIILLGMETQWKGTYLWYIMVPFGVYFIYKIRKLELIFGYAIAALGLLAFQAISHQAPLMRIFWYLSYFYIFIMVIEPKTTPIKNIGKFLFGVGVAAVVFILTTMVVKFDAELAGLLILNIFTPLLNKIT